MAEQAKIERLLRLIQLLVGSFGYSVSDISKRLEMSERTVYRYIDSLKNAGFIFEKSDIYFRISKQTPYLKDLSDLLHFTKEESWILNKAILSLDDDTVIKQSLAAKLYSLYDLKGLPYPVVKKETSEKVINLIRAIESKKQVMLCNYQSSNSGKISDRIAEPFDFTLNYSYIWCYEPESKANKLFKTARIQKVVILNNDWKFHSKHQADETDIFRISGKQRFDIELIMNLRAANLLVEEYPVSEDFLTKSSENEFHFNAWVCSFEGIGRFVLGLFDEIEVIGSDAFKEFLKKKLQKMKI